MGLRMRQWIGVVVLCVFIQACEEDGPSIFLMEAGTAPDAGADAAKPLDGSLGLDAASDSGTATIDRSHLSNTGTAPLDYADPALWACRKGNEPNECHTNLDATEIMKDGSRKSFHTNVRRIQDSTASISTRRLPPWAVAT